jgi:hypothetical protein
MRLTRDPNADDEVQISMSHEEFTHFQTGLRTMWHFLSAEVMRNIQRYGLAQNVSREPNPMTGGVVSSEETKLDAIARLLNETVTELSGTDKAVDFHNRRLGVLELVLFGEEGPDEELDDQFVSVSILERIIRLEKKVEAEPVPRRRPFQALTTKVDDLREDIQAINDQLEAWKVTIDQFKDRVSALEAPVFTGPTAARLFHAPKSGGLFVTGEEVKVEFSDETRDRVAGAAAMRKESYDRGLSAGASQALLGARHRVQEYLDRHHFSEHTKQDLTGIIGTEL